MKWAAAVGIAVVVLLIVLYEWPRIGEEKKKEKAAFAALTAFGCVLGGLLILFPGLPGPTQWVEAVFRPFGRLLE